MPAITRALLTGRATGSAVKGGRSASGRTRTAWAPVVTGSADMPAIASPVFTRGGLIPLAIADVVALQAFTGEAAVAARALIRAHVVVHALVAHDGGPVCDVCGEERSDPAHSRRNASDPARYLRVSKARRLRDHVAAHAV